MDRTEGLTHLYINPVKTDRADEWEAFTLSEIIPVVARQRPDLVGRTRLLRADAQDDGTTPFAFVFEGLEIDDYDLEPIFAAEHGEQEGRQRLAQWQEMYAGDQVGWTFRKVPLPH